MGFKDRYTTNELISKDKPLDPKDVISLGIKDYVPENAKVVLSNDAFAIGEMLETLINTTRNK